MIQIYLITNTDNGKHYVGQTRIGIYNRFDQHCYALSLIGEAIREFGREKFIVEVIETCETKAQADERENFFITKYNCLAPNGYNQKGGIVQPENKSSPLSLTEKLKDALIDLAQIDRTTTTALARKIISDYVATRSTELSEYRKGLEHVRAKYSPAG